MYTVIDYKKNKFLLMSMAKNQKAQNSTKTRKKTPKNPPPVKNPPVGGGPKMN